MAKQTFTTGQVLTAAQMTSLQQTAMGGGEATAKTASYVLTAADAGTTVIMNAAGATTITVNTALFAAGDTVNIQNIGAGVCTVTAGTATVNTAGSLALGQYEGGVLYFRSTSAATFFDYVQTGAVSPLTTKGDVWGYSTLDARIPVGADATVLTADSTQALGLKWATPASGGMTSLASGSLSGTSTSIGTIPSGYIHLFLILRNPTAATVGNSVKFRVNSTSNIYSNGLQLSSSSDTLNAADVTLLDSVHSTSAENAASIWFYDYLTTATSKLIFGQVLNKNAASTWYQRTGMAVARTSSAITSIQIEAASTLSGTYVLYGVK